MGTAASNRSATPRRDPREALPLTHVAYHVLLALESEPLHGYGIIGRVLESTSGQVELEAGTLYGAIKRMKEEGWLEELPPTAGADTRRRTYRSTRYGRQVLRAEAERLEAMVSLARDARVLGRPNRAKA